MNKIKRKIYFLFNKYSFNKSDYPNSFLSYDSEIIYSKKQVSKVIYCFWTGRNQMSEDRLKCLRSISENSDVEVKLITPDNLSSYVLPNFPLHKAYEHLSLVHKSDYLRCYFMHHYGGGYSDIKFCENSWNTLFDDLNATDFWALGYQEIGPEGVARTGGVLEIDLKIHYSLVIGNCSYICKPQTPFTNEWYIELHKRLDSYYDELKKNPGNVMGDNEGYPIPWTNILGDIFHPLCLKHHDKLLFSDTLKPRFENYR